MAENQGVKKKSKGKRNLPQLPGPDRKNATIVKPILYGNTAWLLNCKEGERTHQWSVYLRSYNNEDMSTFIKRVEFLLHESYEEKTRICHSPPYEVQETGWGEFSIRIKICFHDYHEKPVLINHYLKLYERDEDGRINEIKSSEAEPICSEYYDELIFTNPTEAMYKLLKHPRFMPAKAQHSIDYELKKEQDLQKILQAKQKMWEEMEDLKSRLLNATEDLNKMKLHDEKLSE